MPDVHGLAARLPGSILGSAVLAGILFSLGNAAMEEMLFRGMIYDALESQWGWATACVASAAFFGVLHVAGYPPGALGAALAGIYGLLLGWLRHRTGGLLLPTAAHVFADATIFGILVHTGVL